MYAFVRLQIYPFATNSYKFKSMAEKLLEEPALTTCAVAEASQ